MDKIKPDKTKNSAAKPTKHTTYFLTADCPKSHSTTTVTKVSHLPQESPHVPLKPSMSCDSVDSFFFSDVSVISRAEVDGEHKQEDTDSAVQDTSTEQPDPNITATNMEETSDTSYETRVHPSSSNYSHSTTGLNYPLNMHPHLKSLSVVSSKPASLLSMDSASSSPRLDASDNLLSETLLSSDDDESEGGTRVEQRMPQFIMPTIPLTSRRPFTETGLRLGKLRVMVAGQRHSGKSALIRSFVQQCKDIVYVDAAAPIVTPLPRSKAARNFHEPVMWETQASTRPTPVFETMSPGTVSESSTLTATDNSTSTLDFNISFVECSQHSVDWLDHAIAYLEQQLQRTSQMINPMSPNCSKIMMTSSGMDNVDACLFLLSKPPDAEQLEQMRILSSYVPLIPLVSKSDSLSDRKLAALKLRILRDLEREGIQPFAFDFSVSDILSVFEESDLLSSDDDDQQQPRQAQSLATPLIRRSTTPQFPFSVSAVAELELDASVLMNPNYTPKLVTSDLDMLCGQLFSEKGASWLRYKSGQQFISWAVTMQQAVTLRGVRRVAHEPVPQFYIPEFVVSPVAVPLTIDHNLLANQSTVDWISHLKTESGVLVQVTESRGPAYNCLGCQKYSHSISNVDPLELKRHFKLLNKLVSWACKALSYTIGASLVVKMVTVCMQGELYAPPPPPQTVSKEGPLNDAAQMLCRVFENVSRELMAVADFTF
ncbi:hypothetical protein B0I72DRAFT_136827 [Yarrowia lipolytica]|uniref:YALI0F09009p n=2 Tax=Yarrowia lipolytica TaxID=4952 RepID=Q6C2C5_YARLI|nr:YALI0F09009p [Yarrowia lipolytica CLIB122]AOW06885.1 hypothetical protein YALI1_F12578g [Yarrowia lipolytica]KAB8284057.1 hypothetical protein BKA91DRAFT_135670 [Yarrowia lipolytica]KAE8173644.1 hypothetical protein BKA90DRAFT_135303 [Yarrowia lipolytica]KAJ8055929.1 hypothetical protein LXG23DRAFT_35567 [Yarrowia lipolytica]RDW26721.1 hypothetical protein B0I71DRAFT_130342 [Yarrowia lipolytica]|eukprot:XP_505187.1 YALI0F09009p [Yarrowia lipolytica CLIB122]